MTNYFCYFLDYGRIIESKIVSLVCNWFFRTDYIALGSLGDAVHLVSNNTCHIIETEGYDVLAPAITNDNKVVVADYYGLGVCAFTTSGQKIFKNEATLGADMLPMINNKGIVAIGSKNNECSYFLNKNGELIHTGEFPAVFTEYIDGGWIELSHNKLRRLSVTYQELWSITVNKKNIWGLDLPIVDKDGLIFVATKYNLLCIDENGLVMYKLKYEKHTYISMIGNKQIGFVNKGYLHVIS